MTCRPCTSLRESVAGFFVTSFSDTSQLSLWNGNPTPVASCGSEPQKDGSPDCTCGKETLGCSIHPNTPEEWVASMQDSLAKMFPQAGYSAGLEQERAVVFTGKYCESLTWYDQDTSSWKTFQQSLVTDWEQFSGTWPRWGLMLDGVAYRLQVSEPAMQETDGGSLPSGNYNRKGAIKTSGDGLITALLKRRKFPTLNAVQGNCVGRLDELGGSGNPFRGLDVGRLLLNPSFAEEFMGFPIGGSELKDSETRKSRSKPQPRGVSLVGSEAA